MPEINEALLRQMHETNSEQIKNLQTNQKEINETLTKMHGVLERIDEKLKRTEEIEKALFRVNRDIDRAKGMGKVAGIVLSLGEGLLLALLERRH